MIDLSKEVGNLLEKYGEEVNHLLQEAVPKVAKGAVKQLKSSSPKDTGKYAKGWTSKVEKSRLGVSATVYGGNKTGSIAHLLEHGHAKRNGGRVPGNEHIRPVEEWASEELVNEIERGLT